MSERFYFSKMQIGYPVNKNRGKILHKYRLINVSLESYHENNSFGRYTNIILDDEQIQHRLFRQD